MSNALELLQVANGLDKDELVSLLVETQIKNGHLDEELTISNTALEMVKDENEVNKKNMMKFMKENKELKEDIDDAVENHFSDLKLRETTYKEWNTLEEENKKLKDQIERERYEHNREIMKLQDTHYLEEVSPLEKQVEELKQELDKHQDPTENEKRLLKQLANGFLLEIQTLKPKATAWDIHNRGDWEQVSQGWDKQQCLDLIECGECEPEDFEGHEEYNRID